MGAILLLVFGYWFSFLNGKEGRKARKEMASGDGWMFVYLAWAFLIFGIAYGIAWLSYNLSN